MTSVLLEVGLYYYLLLLRSLLEPGMVTHLKYQHLEDRWISKFKASLVYIGNSRPVRAT